MLPVLLLALLPEVHAQACACSRNPGLPLLVVTRPWEGLFVAGYGVSYASDPDSWLGFASKDRLGDSMEGMYMPPQVFQTATLGAALGLPGGFGVGTTVPWMTVHHVHPSGMAGDVDASAPGDVGTTLLWGRSTHGMDRYFGANLGVTWPTGLTRAGGGTRFGRGTIGATGVIWASRKVAPRWGVMASVGGATGFGLDATGYGVGPSATGSFGARFSLREGGPVILSASTLLRWQGTDVQDALVYENTGYLSHDLSLGASWNVWSHHQRSATLFAGVNAPLWQIVGDPMYAENVSGSLGASLVAF